MPVIINARWSFDGISVQYADYFAVVAFRMHLRRVEEALQALTPIRIRNSFKGRGDEVKQRYNYQFPTYIRDSYKPQHGEEDVSAYQFLITKK